MTTANSRRLEKLTYISLLCFLITWSTLFLWICAFNVGTEQSENVKIYLSYFPASIGLVGITIGEVILCIASITLSSICLKRKENGLITLNIFILVGISIRLMLMIFGFM